MSSTADLREVFNPRETQSAARRKVIKSGIIAALIAVFCFVTGLMVFGIPQLLPGRLFGFVRRFISWDSMGSVTSLATFALVMGGLVFAFIDYVQNAVQRKREESESSFNMYKVVYDRLMKPDSITARRWVIVNLPTLEKMNNDQAAWFACIKSTIDEIPVGSGMVRAPGKEYVKTILNDLDFIGFVHRNYWKMDNDLVKWMSSPVAKVWERIYLYVEKEGDERQEKDYYEAAREFGEQCVKWRKEQGLKSEVSPNGL
jgi:hypothetical protein